MASPKNPRSSWLFQIPKTVDPVLRAFLRQGGHNNVAMFLGNEKGPTYSEDSSGQVAEVYIISVLRVAQGDHHLVALYMPNWHPTRSEFAVAEYLHGDVLELWEARAEDNTLLLPATDHYKKLVAVMGIGPSRQGSWAECDWYGLERRQATETLRVKQR